MFQNFERNLQSNCAVSKNNKERTATENEKNDETKKEATAFVDEILNKMGSFCLVKEGKTLRVRFTPHEI